MNNITNILDAIEQRTGIKPTAFSSTNIEELPSISYLAYRQYDNAVIEQWRFQTRITAESYEEAISIEEDIADLLCSLGDEADFGTLRIEVNGGGTLEDDNTGLAQILTYYDIQNKS